MEIVCLLILTVSILAFLLGMISYPKPWSSLLLRGSYFMTLFSISANISSQALNSEGYFSSALSILIGLMVASLFLAFWNRTIGGGA